MTDTPIYAHWTEGNAQRQALWRAENGDQPPRRIVVIDDACTADAAFRLASQGSFMLWRGDFHNARQLLNAVARRIDQHRARQRKNKAGTQPEAGAVSTDAPITPRITQSAENDVQAAVRVETKPIEKE